jgi:hypothetical protein
MMASSGTGLLGVVPGRLTLEELGFVSEADDGLRSDQRARCGQRRRPDGPLTGGPTKSPARGAQGVLLPFDLSKTENEKAAGAARPVKAHDSAPAFAPAQPSRRESCSGYAKLFPLRQRKCKKHAAKICPETRQVRGAEFVHAAQRTGVLDAPERACDGYDLHVSAQFRATHFAGVSATSEKAEKKRQF